MNTFGFKKMCNVEVGREEEELRGVLKYDTWYCTWYQVHDICGIVLFSKSFFLFFKISTFNFYIKGPLKKKYKYAHTRY